MKLPWCCLVGIATLVALSWGPGLAGEKLAGPAIPDAAQALLDLTNAERAREGKKPLKLNAQLTKAAQAHSDNMVRQQKLEHHLDGQGPDQRLRQAGYKFSLWGENIAMASSAEGALKMWMGSKGHRDNILKEQFTEIGIGVTKSNKGKLFFTQTFAKPGRM